ncbi:MAG: phosphodiester glycosidase family protein [Clostridia bacterium]|nr:phosphodiester glycosidase family protein [Clostridia bacterium]
MMKSSMLRWIIAALLLVCLTLTLSCPSIVEAEEADAAEDEHPTLPLDFTVGGTPPKEANWVYDEEKTPVGYEDSTIRISVEKGSVTLTVKKQKVKHETRVVRIAIRDVSQLRTAVSKDTYKGRGQASADSIAKSKNAVVAMNGDFFKYENDVGYVVRQGEFIRDATDNRRKRFFDMLVIDSAGDFHAVYAADTAKIEAFIAEELTPNGLTILDTFNLGPVLVVDGEAQDMTVTAAARQSSYQWKYAQQRIALVQTGKLEYAIVEVYGKTDSSAGMTLQEFAEFIAEQCPGALMAYNLDGGGSTNLIVNNTRICKTPGRREITDIIYFASAEE